MQNLYYVYFLLDPRTSQPFYVGKGNGTRIMYHEVAVRGNYKTANLPHHDRIRELIALGLAPIPLKTLVDVEESVALKAEMDLINFYGRVHNNSGILLNRSAGSLLGSGTSPKPVDQFDLNGVLVNSWESAKQASENIPAANASYISQVCQGKQISAGGFLWAYKGNSPRPYVKGRQRAVEQFTKDGVSLQVFPTQHQAQLATGISSKEIGSCCRRPGSSAGGFKWSYA